MAHYIVGDYSVEFNLGEFSPESHYAHSRSSVCNCAAMHDGKKNICTEVTRGSNGVERPRLPGWGGSAKAPQCFHPLHVPC